MAAKQHPPDLGPELNHQILTFKEGLRHSLGHGDSVEMMIGGGSGGSLHESFSYTGDGGDGRLRRGGDKQSNFQRWTDSFRRDPKGRMTPKNAFIGGMSRNYYDLRAANYRTAHPLLAKELKGRHLQMIAIGGSIGEWLYLVSFCAGCPWATSTRDASRATASSRAVLAGASAQAVRRRTFSVSPMWTGLETGRWGQRRARI